MHEPVEILSPSRRSSPPPFLPSFELRFSFPFFFSLLLVPPFISLFAAAYLPPVSLPLAALYSRGARILVTFEFNFRTQRRCRKTFTGYKGSPMERCKLRSKKKKKKEREGERKLAGEARYRKEGTRMRLTAKRARDGKRYRRTIFVRRKMSRCNDRHRVPAASRHVPTSRNSLIERTSSAVGYSVLR